MLWSLTLEDFHSLPVGVLIAEADKRFLYGSLWPKRLGCESGVCRGQKAGPLARLFPTCPPHLGVLHQAGQGLLLSISVGIIWPEGAEGRTALLAQPSRPHHGLCREHWPGGSEQKGRFRETEDGQAEGRARGTHKVWGFRK